MATPYRGYTEVPGGMTPDVPYRLNLALREVDADVQDLEMATAESHQEIAGRLAVVESAAGFGSGMSLQDDAVNSLVKSGTSKTSKAIQDKINTLSTQAVDTALDTEGTPLRETFDALTLEHLGQTFHGPMEAWGNALRNHATKPAIWVSLGSSTANGGNTDNFGLSWAGRIATYLTQKPITSDAVKGLDGTTSRPANGVHCYNGAVGGTTSGNYVTAAKLSAIKALQPALITHMVGANDLGSGTSLATYKTNLRNYMDQIQAASPGSVHLYIHQQGRVAASPKLPWADYGDAMREVAEAYPNVAFLNAGQVFSATQQGLAPHLVADNLHMNNNGHRLLADLVAEAMGNPIPYAGPDIHKANNLQGGASDAERLYASVPIPTAPYPRTLTANVAMFAYGTKADQQQGPEASVFAHYTDVNPPVRTGDAVQIRFMNGGVGRALTYTVSPTWRVDANRPVELQIVTGPQLYTSAGAVYNEVQAILNPA